MERVVRALEQVQLRPVQGAADFAHQLQVGQLVPRALQEQRGHGNARQVGGAFGGRPARGVKGKAEEDQPGHAGQLRCRRRHRGHPSTHRLSPGQQGQRAGMLAGRRDG